MHVAAEASGLRAQRFRVLGFRDFGEERRFRVEGHQSGVMEGMGVACFPDFAGSYIKPKA